MDILQGLFKSDISSNTTASRIVAIYEPLLKQGPRTSPMTTFWSILCDGIKVLVGDKEIAQRYVDLLNSISSLMEVETEHDSLAHPEERITTVYWKRLLDLGIMFRDYAISRFWIFCSRTLPR